MADGKQPGFVGRLGQITVGGFKESMSHYFNDVSRLKSDADTIKTQLIQDGKSVADVFNRMKKGMGSPAKKIHDWFYANESSMSGLFDGDDDFDAGFKPDAAGDETAEPEVRNLSADDMTDIAKKQTADQYKIASKQADLNIANTAEIVSAINSRSAEMTASINKVNESLITISKKLDGIMGGIDEANKEKEKQASIFDNDGSLSLLGMFNAGHESVKEKTEMLGMLKSLKILLTPEGVVSAGFSKLFKNEFSFLGGNSVEDLSRRLNDAIADSVQTGLMSLIKNDKFQTLFGDMGDRAKNKDFQSLVANNYNTKPAVFDGMTRQSIIHIIPEYLKNIEAAITNSAPKTINEKGQLTTRNENYFQNNVRDSMFGSLPMEYGAARTNMLNSVRSYDADFSSKDLDLALKALKSGFLMILLNGIPFNSKNRENNNYRQNAQAILHPDEVGPNAPTTWEAREMAIKMLMQSSGKSAAYWENVFDHILGIFETNRTERQKFARKCTSEAEKVIKEAEKFAKTHTHAHQAGKITFDLVSGAFTDAYQRANYNDTKGTVSGAEPVTPVPKPSKTQQSTIDTASSNPKSQSGESHSAASIIPEIINGPSGIPSINSSLKGIYDILNRGLDVFVVNKKGVFGSQTTPFGQGGSSSSSNNKGKGGKKNKKERQSSTAAQQDYVDSTASNSEEDNSMFQEPENVDENGNVREEPKKKSFFNRISEVLHTPLKGSAVIPGALKAKEEATEVVSETYNEILDQIAPEGSRMREFYDQITESDRAQAAKEKGKKIANTVTDKILGEETEEIDEETGEAKRKGGLFGWFGNKKEKVTNKAKDKVEKGKQKVKSKIDNKIAEEESKLSDVQILEATQENIKKVQKMADTAAEKSEKPEEGTSSAQQDQMIVQQVMAMIEVAMKDGEISAADIMTINNLINQVKDQKIKKQLKQAVVPMMRRNATSVAGVPQNQEGKNGLEKGVGIGFILKSLVKYSKLIFKPITTILGSGLKIIGGIGVTVGKLLGKVVKSGLSDIKYGAKAIGRNLFGSKKEGYENEGLIKKILLLPNRLLKGFNGFTNNFFPKLFDKGREMIGRFAGFVTDLGKDLALKVGEFALKVGDKIKGWFANGSGFLSSIKEKIGESSFGQKIKGVGKGISAVTGGFFEGLNEANREQKEARKAANEKKLLTSEPTTKAEAEAHETNTLLGIIKDDWKKNFDTEEENNSKRHIDLISKLDMISELLGKDKEEDSNENGSDENKSENGSEENKSENNGSGDGSNSQQSSDNQSDSQQTQGESGSNNSEEEKEKKETLREKVERRKAEKEERDAKRRADKEERDARKAREKEEKAEANRRKRAAKEQYDIEKKALKQKQKSINEEKKRIKSMKALTKEEKNRIKAEKKAAKEALKNSKNKYNRAVGKTTLGDRFTNARESADVGAGTIAKGVGGTLSGIFKSVNGVAKILAAIFSAVAGFQVLMDLIQNTLTKSLTPLNSAFQKAIKVLKPVLKILKDSLKSVATAVSTILESLIDSIKPILTDIIGPLLEQITPIITRIGDILVSLLPLLNTIIEVLLMPLVTSILGILVPAISLIASVVQIISGWIEMFMGAFMAGIGLILQGIGKIVPVFGGGIEKAGENMKTNGVSLMQAGKDMAGAGIRGIASTLASTFTAIFGKDEEEEEKEEEKPKEKKEADPMKGSALEGLTGMGDTTVINNYNNSSSSTGQIGDISNIYGSGESQMVYGGYLGMDKHGCGPTALADAASRRSGQKLSAGALASAMAGNGSYSASKGTSVAGFIKTSAALGSHVTPGGVSQASLKRATPNNPVTLIGSGAGFGTKSGNNHYVNVIGSNGKGMSYVSNPLSGRVERRPTSDLVGHSVLGLYGSGDMESSGDYYTFPEAVSDAIAELKSLAANLLKMFTGSTAEEKMQEELNKTKQEQALKDAENQLGDDFTEFDKKARAAAAEDYRAKHPKLDSETEDEYEAKIDEYYTANRMKYLAKTKVLEAAAKKSGNMFANILQLNDNTSGAINDSFSSIGSTSSSYGVGGGSGGFYNSDGSARMFDFGDIIHKETNITSGESGESPVHDFFGTMGGAKAYSSSAYQNWYSLRQDPNTKGVGQSGDSHNGLDIQWEGGNAGKPLYTITGGTVTDYRYSESGGNMIRWTDDSGKYSHIYMHMQDLPAGLKAGDRVEAGTLVGHVGNTGASGGAHLHYGMYKDSGWGSSSGINPLEYWHYEEPSELPGNDNRDKIWSYMVTPQSGGGMGLSKHGAAGILANMETESHFEPRREEGNYPNPIKDTSYNDNVDNGSYSMNQFVNDGKGFGLVQWTPNSRKTGLWEFTRGKNMSIGNLRGQLDYFRHEMETESYYASMLENMRSGNPSYTYMEAMEDFLRRYEIPADISGNVYIRGPQAKEIYDHYANTPIPDTLDISLQKTYGNVGSGTVSGKNITINSQGDYEYFQKNRPDIGGYVTIAPNAEYYYTDTKGNTSYARFGSDLQKLDWILDSINDDGTYNIKSVGGNHTFTKKIDFGYVTKRDVIQGPQKPVEQKSGNSNGSGTAQFHLDHLDELRKAEEAKYGTNGSTWTIFEDYAKAYHSNDDAKMAYRATGIRSLKDVNGAYIDPSQIDWDSEYYKYLGTRGSGDSMESSIISNIDANAPIPPLDGGNLPDTDFWTGMGLGTNTGTSIYNITKTDDKAADARVKSILDHTFEVKSASIEGILTKILDRMEEKRTESANVSPMNLPSNQKLFEERIPSSISKLSIG